MNAVPLTDPHLLPSQAPQRSPALLEREGGSVHPAADPGTATAQFPPLDPASVSDAIPAFFIGRNKEGFWVARDARGLIGGLFLSKSGALSFARRNSRPVGCATIFPSQVVELDLNNSGNPLVMRLGVLKRLARRARQRIVALIAGSQRLIQTRA